MNKPFAVIALLASATCAAQAVERPDGLLGTNYISFSGIYANVRYDDSDAPDLDYSGMGLSINQHLFTRGDVGVDVALGMNYLTNQNNTDIYSLDQYAYNFSTTVYRAGMVSPYFRGSLSYDYAKIKYKGTPSWSDDDDTIIFGMEVGAECHLMPGWSVTPFIAGQVDTDADDEAWTTTIGASTTYWLTERIGTTLTAQYTLRDQADTFSTALAIRIHY